MQVHTEVTISAAHHLPLYEGKCADVHGHSWKIEVDIVSKVNKKTGMVVDFSKIKDIINQLDHKDINDFISNPTAENIVKFIMVNIKNKLKLPLSAQVRVTVWESATSWACDNY